MTMSGRKQRECKQKGYEFDLECARAAGINASKIIVSTTKPELKAAADDIYYFLAISTPKKSSLKSYADLKKEMASLKTSHEKVQYEIEKMNEKIEKMKRDIKEEKEFASTVRSVAWKTWWVPIAGLVGAVGLALRATAAESFAGKLEKDVSVENNHIIEMKAKDPAEDAKSMEERLQKLKEALEGKAGASPSTCAAFWREL